MSSIVRPTIESAVMDAVATLARTVMPTLENTRQQYIPADKLKRQDIPLLQQFADVSEGTEALYLQTRDLNTYRLELIGAQGDQDALRLVLESLRGAIARDSTLGGIVQYCYLSPASVLEVGNNEFAAATADVLYEVAALSDSDAGFLDHVDMTLADVGDRMGAHDMDAVNSAVAPQGVDVTRVLPTTSPWVVAESTEFTETMPTEITGLQWIRFLVHVPSTEMVRMGSGTFPVPHVFVGLYHQVGSFNGGIWQVPLRQGWNLVSVDLDSVTFNELGTGFDRDATLGQLLLQFPYREATDSERPITWYRVFSRPEDLRLV